METVLTVKRKWFTDKSTIGELYYDGEYLCFTLEDVVRDVKVYGQTAIPEGRYQVVLSFSNRFQKFLPEILNVPNYTGIRMHAGNKPADTEGCVLVGDAKGDDFIGNSRAAMAVLMARLGTSARRGKVWIEIKSEPVPK